MNSILAVITFAVIFFAIVIWATLSAKRQAIKDWKTLEYLENKAKQVSTKEEIEEFYVEFAKKASKIYNRHIAMRLYKIEGYLKGLYKQYEK